jgi:hypothetical protein
MTSMGSEALVSPSHRLVELKMVFRRLVTNVQVKTSESTLMSVIKLLDLSLYVLSIVL